MLPCLQLSPSSPERSSPLSVDPKPETSGAAAYVPPLDANDEEVMAAPDAAAGSESPGVPSGPQSADDFTSDLAITGDPDELLALILSKLDDDQAEEIVTIDLRGKSPIADYIVVASGRSQRHVGAIADHLQRALKDGGFGRCQLEGLPQADWVLIDAGDVVVHLFRPEVRAFYRIEQIWSLETPGAMSRPGSGHTTDSTPQ